MLRVRAQFLQLVKAPRILLEVFRVLALDSAQLPVSGTCRKEGRHKKLRKAIQRALERILVHAEIVTGVLLRSEGVGRASMLPQIGVQLSLYIRMYVCKCVCIYVCMYIRVTP